MSLKPLLKKQTLRIDDHKWGAGEIKTWDNSAIDIHIDKETKYKIDGKEHKVRIKVPINSGRDIVVESKPTRGSNNKKKQIPIPSKLEKEIQEAFQDKTKREQFVEDLIPILENYASKLSTEEKAKETLKSLSKHFGLEWKESEILTFLSKKGDNIISYSQTYTDSDNTLYKFSMNEKGIIITDIKNKQEN